MLRKRLGARPYRLRTDAALDVPKVVQRIADASEIPFATDAVLGAFGTQLKLDAGHLEVDASQPFLDWFTADGTAAQRALAVGSVLAARGLLS